MPVSKQLIENFTEILCHDYLKNHLAKGGDKYWFKKSGILSESKIKNKFVSMLIQ